MKLRRRGPSPEQLPAVVEDDPGMSAKVLSHVLESSSRLQAPAVRAYVARLRRANPGAAPAEIVTKLEKHYLAAVMASGAAVGSAAAFPGIGTLAALSAVAGETVVFFEATAAFVLAVADVHGIPVEDRERRRNLVSASLSARTAGARSRTCLVPGAPAAPGWPKPSAAAAGVIADQHQLMQHFVKKYTVKRTAMAFGKMLPVGIGAAIGGGGNRMMGKKIVENARAAFGPAPDRWQVILHVLPAIEEGRERR